MNFIRYLLFTFLWAVIVYCIFNCWYEDSDLIYVSLMDGSLLKEHYGNFEFMAHYKIQIIYVWLYNHIRLPWYPLILGFFQIVAVSLLARIVLIQLKGAHTLLKAIVLAEIFIGCAVPHLVFMQHTRISYLLTVSALLTAFGYTKWKSPLIYPLGILLFAVGFLTRIESGLSATIFTVGFHLVYSRFSFQSWKQCVLPVLFSSAVLLTVHDSIQHAPNFLWQIEPEVEYRILDRQSLVPISEMKNLRDSVRYEAASQWMVADSVQTSPQFLRSILKPNEPLLLPLGQVLNTWLNLWNVIRGYLLMLTAVILLYVGSLFYSKDNRLSKILLLLLALALLVAPSLTVKSEPRHIAPYATITLVLFTISMWKSKPAWMEHRLVLVTLLLITAYSIVNNLKQTAESVGEYKKLYTQNMFFFSQLKDTFPDKQIVFWGPISFVERPVFSTFEFSNQAFTTTDMSQLMYTPEMKQYIQKKFPCNFYDYACRMRHIIANKNRYIIVSDDSRWRIHQRFLVTLYAMKFNCAPAIPHKSGTGNAYLIE